MWFWIMIGVGSFLVLSLLIWLALGRIDGRPPAAFYDVTVTGHEGLFRVVKVATSPLPNDRRVCAYLQQSEV